LPRAPITRASVVPKLKENKGSSGKIQPKLDFSFDGEKHDEDDEEGKSVNERTQDLNQINKVNEMDVKVSRFEHTKSLRNLEDIPSEANSIPTDTLSRFMLHGNNN